jgi:hypothetical protein
LLPKDKYGDVGVFEAEGTPFINPTRDGSSRAESVT